MVQFKQLGFFFFKSLSASQIKVKIDDPRWNLISLIVKLWLPQILRPYMYAGNRCGVDPRRSRWRRRCWSLVSRLDWRTQTGRVRLFCRVVLLLSACSRTLETLTVRSVFDPQIYFCEICGSKFYFYCTTLAFHALLCTLSHSLIQCCTEVKHLHNLTEALLKFVKW